MPRAEGKDDDEDEGKSGGDSKDAKGGDAFDDNELLMMVASDAQIHLYGERSELTAFIAAHSPDWAEAARGEDDGTGSPLKAMGGYRAVHAEYLEMMEEILTAIVEKNGGTLKQFMADAKHALEGGDGFLFEDENYGDFVESVQAMTDYEAFHAMMIKHARKSGAAAASGK